MGWCEFSLACSCPSIIFAWTPISSHSVGYGKSEVRVDDKVMKLKINGNICYSAVAVESDFHIAWHGEFKTWTELQNDEKVKKLIDTVKKKL